LINNNKKIANAFIIKYALAIYLFIL
jgi:hypothetical protein